jgi:hypothetical protein
MIGALDVDIGTYIFSAGSCYPLGSRKPSATFENHRPRTNHHRVGPKEKNQNENRKKMQTQFELQNAKHSTLEE